MDLEEERGKKILRQIGRLERRKRAPRVMSCLPWVLVIVLVLAIAVVLLVNWDKLSVVWSHLIRPDSIPGIRP